MASRRRPPRRKPPSKKPAGKSLATGTVAPAKPRPQPARGPAHTPIVGVGASAGGLDALEHFFDAVPGDSNLAFVVVTHQQPGHGGLLRGLLKKHTPMRVLDVTDGMRVAPNTVYLSPAGKNMSLLRGSLYVTDPGPKEGLRLPIDFFFRELAQDRKHEAIGIVLSGAGADGTLGLQAIRGEAGMAVAQDPLEADYPGMPQSAIAAGAADLVLPVAEMPERVMAHARNPHAIARGAPVEGDPNLSKIFTLLRNRTGNDFSNYKVKTILRRIEKRMNVNEIGSMAAYLRFLQDSPQETEALFRDLLIGVTSFFRDAPAYEALWRRGLAPLLKTKPDSHTLRLWVPGCSTGEEAYSLAMALRERLDRHNKRNAVQIFATDLDKHAVETARAGLYPGGIAGHVSPRRLQHFFSKEGDGYRVKKDIRSMVVFAPHNLLADPPFTKLDLISCRNVLIYLEPKAQRLLLQFFHYALKPGGLLLLGASETVSTQDHLFDCLDRKWKLFARRDVDRRYAAPEGLPVRLPPPAPAVADRQPPAFRRETVRETTAIETMLLDRYVPASVIVNDRGEIVFIHGRTGSFLEPAPGPPNRQLVEMAREGLRSSLAAALLQVSRRRSKTVRQQVQVRHNGGEIPVRLTVRRLAEPEALRGLILITFEPGAEPAPEPAPPAGKAGRRRPGRQPGRADGGLEQELAYTKHRLQLSIEELETSSEEFKATNEELQSTNEELQSTNEELETAKEELQSLNEELVTLNSEMHAKLDELSNANDDMQNLLNSTEVATIFLDTDLNIRRFTEEARTIVNLIPADVGRPLSDLVTNLTGSNLLADIHEVLLTLVRKEVEVATTDGRWYFLRILPYRTSRNVIDGAVLAFLDITRQKKAEAASEAARRYAESIIATLREPLLVLDAELRIVTANKAFFQAFRLTSPKVEGQLIYHLAQGQWDIPQLRKLLERILPADRLLEGFEVDHVFPVIGRRRLVVNARRLDEQDGLPAHILVAFEDRTGHHAEPPAGPPARPTGGSG